MRNHISYLKTIAAVLFACLTVTLAACEDSVDDLDITSNLKVSDRTVTLGADGQNGYTVGVESAMQWAVMLESEGNWLVKAASDTDSFTIAAEANMSQDARTGKVIVSDGIQNVEIMVVQNGIYGGIPDENGQLPVYRSIQGTEMSPVVMSANGRYIVGVRRDMKPTGGYDYVSVIIDVHQDSRIECEPITTRVLPASVSNEGTFIVRALYSAESHIYDRNGNKLEIPQVPGYNEVYVEGISDDGSVIVGYVVSNWIAYPVKWTNGTAQLLETLTEDFFGNSLWNGCQALGCSADGSVIWGGEGDSAAALFWRTDGSVEYAGMDKFDYVETEFSKYPTYLTVPEATAPMSPNGRYLGTMIYHLYDLDIDGLYVYYPAVFDTETETTTIFREFSGNDAYCTTISDEGLAAMAIGRIHNLETGVTVNSSEWIKEKYGLEVNANPSIWRFATDGKTILGRNNDSNSLSDSYTYFYIYYPSTTE